LTYVLEIANVFLQQLCLVNCCKNTLGGKDMNNMKTVASHIRAHGDSLSNTERRVADYILDNQQHVINMSMMEIANDVGVSDASVLRFVRSIGFKGFNDFKIALATSLYNPREAIFEKVDPVDDVETIARKVINSNIQLLKDTLAFSDFDQIEKSINEIKQAQRIYIFAVGTSSPMAARLYDRLFRLGYPATAITDTYHQLMQAAIIAKGDLIIAVSQSGTPETLFQALLVAKEKGAKLIAITCNEASKIAKLAEVNISGVTEEVWSDISGSLVPIAALIDILYTCLEINDIEKASLNQHEMRSALGLLRR